MLLITGASGMLGRYIKEEFDGFEIRTLGLSEGNDFVCDLTKYEPSFREQKFETVIHCAGTENDEMADELNYKGTQALVKALSLNPPENFVYISSYRVYSEDAGENIKEEENLFATTEAGKSKARAEEYLRDWALKNDVTLTIIRPALMFGNGVKGKALELFNDAIDSKYIHVRGNDARVSVVTAYDVARIIRKIFDRGGVYNVADNFNPRLIDLVEAMTANAGGKKRMTHLPLAWAEWIWRLGRWIPSIDRNLSPETVEKRMKTFTLDGTKAASVAGLTYFNTLEVLERTHSSYPYSM